MLLFLFVSLFAAFLSNNYSYEFLSAKFFLTFLFISIFVQCCGFHYIQPLLIFRQSTWYRNVIRCYSLITILIYQDLTFSNENRHYLVFSNVLQKVVRLIQPVWFRIQRAIHRIISIFTDTKKPEKPTLEKNRKTNNSAKTKYLLHTNVNWLDTENVGGSSLLQ